MVAVSKSKTYPKAVCPTLRIVELAYLALKLEKGIQSLT